jgi:hypothetical protein
VAGNVEARGLRIENPDGIVHSRHDIVTGGQCLSTGYKSDGTSTTMSPGFVWPMATDIAASQAPHTAIRKSFMTVLLELSLKWPTAI